MSYKLHFAKKYEVEFDGGYFNYHQIEFENLLSDLRDKLDDPNEFLMDFDSGASEYCICRSTLRKIIDRITPEYRSKAKEPHPSFSGDSDTSYGDVLEWLNRICDESDPRSDFIHVAWL